MRVGAFYGGGGQQRFFFYEGAVVGGEGQPAFIGGCVGNLFGGGVVGGGYKDFAAYDEGYLLAVRRDGGGGGSAGVVYAGCLGLVVADDFYLYFFAVRSRLAGCISRRRSRSTVFRRCLRRGSGRGGF